MISQEWLDSAVKALQEACPLMINDPKSVEELKLKVTKFDKELGYPPTVDWVVRTAVSYEQALLAKKEEAELKILQHFLPQPLTETEVQDLIRESIDEVGAQGVQDLGKVMKRVMPKLGGRSDGKRVNEMARALLGE